jgi:hypothetical protein
LSNGPPDDALSNLARQLPATVGDLEELRRELLAEIEALRRQMLLQAYGYRTQVRPPEGG